MAAAKSPMAGGGSGTILSSRQRGGSAGSSGGGSSGRRENEPESPRSTEAIASLKKLRTEAQSALDLAEQVREHSSVELCGSHIAICRAMLRSSNRPQSRSRRGWRSRRSGVRGRKRGRRTRSRRERGRRGQAGRCRRRRRRRGRRTRRIRRIRMRKCQRLNGAMRSNRRKIGEIAAICSVWAPQI